MGKRAKRIAVSIGSSENGWLCSCQAQHVGSGAQEHQFGAKSTLGEAEGASGCTETQTPHFSRRQEANCGSCTRALGAV
jgi:hypothetical protein